MAPWTLPDACDCQAAPRAAGLRTAHIKQRKRNKSKRSQQVCALWPGRCSIIPMLHTNEPNQHGRQLMGKACATTAARAAAVTGPQNKVGDGACPTSGKQLASAAELPYKKDAQAPSAVPDASAKGFPGGSSR